MVHAAAGRADQSPGHSQPDAVRAGARQFWRRGVGGDARSLLYRAFRRRSVGSARQATRVAYAHSAYTLILDDEAATEIPLSPSAAGELRKLLGY